MSVYDSKREGMTEIENVLRKLGKCALVKTPVRVKLSLKDLAEIPWIAAELGRIHEEEQGSDEKMAEDEDMEYVVIKDLDERFIVSRDEVDNETWIKNLIQKALRTKPIDATHLVLYTP